MRRAIVGLIAVASLALGAAVAQADGGGWSGGGDGPGMNGVPVVGTVVSTDAANGSFVANAAIATDGMGDQGPGDFGHGGQGGPGDQGQNGQGSGFGGDIAKDDDNGGGTPPATTQVTITTNSSTKIMVNGQPGSVSGMTAGDRFFALFTGSSTDTIQTLVMNPALSVFDHGAPPARQSPQVYAFVGTVTGVDTTAGTVTLTVTRSFPSSLAAANSSVTLTVSSDTMILGGSSNAGGLFGNSLSSVSTGDIVAGGLIGPSGETLTQVEAQPLRVLLDLPGTSSTTPATTTSNEKRDALSAALRMLGDKSNSTKHRHHKRSRSRSHTHHSSRKHAKRG